MCDIRCDRHEVREDREDREDREANGEMGKWENGKMGKWFLPGRWDADIQGLLFIGRQEV